MSKKYYISEHLFFQDLDIEEVWKFFIDYLKNINDEIIIVKWLAEKEFIIERDIFSVTDFRNEEPYKITISHKPFMVNEDIMYQNNHYKLNKNIYTIISKEWLEELKNDLICPSFVIKHKDEYEFLVNYNSIIAKLAPAEFNAFNSLGFEFKEWNVKLNDVI